MTQQTLSRLQQVRSLIEEVKLTAARDLCGPVYQVTAGLCKAVELLADLVEDGSAPSYYVDPVPDRPQSVSLQVRTSLEPAPR